jgi:hypothetical protein
MSIDEAIARAQDEYSKLDTRTELERMADTASVA